jgi:hypothetical protein
VLALGDGMSDLHCMRQGQMCLFGGVGGGVVGSLLMREYSMCVRCG